MCFIELQYFLQCKHTDAYFRSCWVPAGTGENVITGEEVQIQAHYPHRSDTEGEIHVFDRPCGLCFSRSFNAVCKKIELGRSTETSRELDLDELIYEIVCPTYRTGLGIMDERRTIDQDPDPNENEPFNTNTDFDKASFEGSMPVSLNRVAVAHDEALRTARDGFSSTPVCQQIPGSNDDSARMAFDLDTKELMDEYERIVTEDTREVIVYFDKCKHINAFFCPVISEPNEDRQRYHSDCECDRYDPTLCTAQYAESLGRCLVCQQIFEADGQQVGHFKDLVRSDIPQETWTQWGGEYQQYLSRPYPKREWLRHPFYARTGDQSDVERN